MTGAKQARMSLYESESAKLSRELSVRGLTALTNRVNRQSIHYESDIENAFGIRSETDVLLSGSMGDGLGLFYGNGRVDKSSDIDLVTILKYSVVEDGNFTSTAMMVKETDRQSPGYVRLNLIQNNFLRKHCEGKNGKLYLSSGLWMNSVDTKEWRQKYSTKVHGPAIDISLPSEVIADIVRASLCVPSVRISDPAYNTASSTGVHSTDLVTCLECKTWSTEANEWKTRQRQSGWPSKALIDAVVQTGCILAPVGNKESVDKDVQWRICSNRGETLLTASFNETQLQCYFLLKVINTEVLKQASNKHLTSYIMKNTMFWISENVPPDEWHPHLLISCFAQALRQVRKWVQERCMPNYFIVDRNMFLRSEFSPDIATSTVRAIDDILENPISAIKQLELIQQAAFDWKNVKSETDILCGDICFWLTCRRAMAINFYFTGNQILHKAHNFTDIAKSIKNCGVVLRTLESYGGYQKPTCKLVRNSLGVLYYAYAQKHETDENWKKTAREYFQKSEAVDDTHVPLRIATCLLLEGKFEKALGLVKKALAAISMHENLESESLKMGQQCFTGISEMLTEEAFRSLVSLKSPENVSDLKHLHSIVRRDIENQDLDQTEIALKDNFPEFHHAHIFLWNNFCFDVMFTSAEIEVLPKPVRLEAEMKEIEIDVQHIPGTPFKQFSFEGTYVLTINPTIYAYYLKFLVHFEEAKSLPSDDLSGICVHLDECGICLSKLNTILGQSDSNIPAEQRVVGYNLLTYSYMQLGDYRDAAKSIIWSLCLDPEYKLDPKLDNIDLNVAYYHFQVIIKSLLKIECFKPKLNVENKHKTTPHDARHASGSDEETVVRNLQNLQSGRFDWAAEDDARREALLYSYGNQQLEVTPETHTRLNLVLSDITQQFGTESEKNGALVTSTDIYLRSRQLTSESNRELLLFSPRSGEQSRSSTDLEDDKRLEANVFEESLEHRQDNDKCEIILYQRTSSGSNYVQYGVDKLGLKDK